MAQLEWKAYYSVGVEELDLQHAHLLKLINTMHENKAELDIKECYLLLNELIQYAQLHFQTEEKLLANYNYDDLTLQQNDHEAFTIKVFQLNQELTNKGPSIFPTILKFLDDWYLEHIYGVDQNYKALFRKNDVT